jgi:hypothetical protein
MSYLTSHKRAPLPSSVNRFYYRLIAKCSNNWGSSLDLKKTPKPEFLAADSHHKQSCQNQLKLHLVAAHDTRKIRHK